MKRLKDVFGSSRHLSEERLFACYLAERSGDGIDPPTAEHLTDCATCHQQYADLVAFMDQSWVDGDAETAAIFTPDRLASQQQQIARRLELIGQSGRVLSFKAAAEEHAGALTTARPQSAISRAAAGWMVAAALVIGVSAGILFDSRARGTLAPGGGAAITQPAQPSEPTPARVDLPASAEPADDSMFMDRLEAVLDRPRTPELYAFDALTPHVREASYRR